MRKWWNRVEAKQINGAPSMKGVERDGARLAARLGSPTRARTWDLRINSPSLYQLSYRGSGRRARFYLKPPAR